MTMRVDQGSLGILLLGIVKRYWYFETPENKAMLSSQHWASREFPKSFPVVTIVFLGAGDVGIL